MIAIIGILASVVLVSLINARQKAKDAAYISYIVQLRKAVEAVAVSGAFNSITGAQYGCLGLYSHTAGDMCWNGSPTWEKTNLQLNDALATIASIPKGQVSPYNSSYGTMYYANSVLKEARVYAFVSSDAAKTTEICDKVFGQGNYTSGGNYCYLQISLD